MNSEVKTISFTIKNDMNELARVSHIFDNFENKYQVPLKASYSISLAAWASR